MACKELLFVMMVAVTLDDILAATPRPVEGRFANLRERRDQDTRPPDHWRLFPGVTTRRPGGATTQKLPRDRRGVYDTTPFRGRFPPWHRFPWHTTAPPLEDVRTRRKWTPGPNSKDYVHIMELPRYTHKSVASEVCGLFEAKLPIPTDEEENRALLKMRPYRGTEYFWLGINDRKEEGKFVPDNTTGPAMNFTKWQPNEGNNTNSDDWEEDCVVLHPEGWKDVPCMAPFSVAVVCERRRPSNDGNDYMALRHASEGAKLRPGALVMSLGLGVFLLTSFM